MAEYGIPYMGSKSSICDDLISIFPKAQNFYDLFGGGFSITHAMLLKRRDDFNNFYFNEIRPGICELIQEAIAGKFNYNNFKPEWISSTEFRKQKDSNAYVKICWSFGNNGQDYLFSKTIEQYKKSIHNAIVFNDFDNLAKELFGCNNFKESTITQRRLYWRYRFSFYQKNIDKRLQQLQRLQQLEQLQQLQRLQQLEQLQQLQQLERLQRLQQLQQLEQLDRLQQLERLHFLSLSYDQVEIKQNSIIYCDPPYANTAKYDVEFDHKKFFDWANAQENPVFISEYKIIDNRFRPVFKINKTQKLSSKSRIQKNEFVYVNQSGFDFLMNRRNKPQSDNGDCIEKAKIS